MIETRIDIGNIEKIQQRLGSFSNKTPSVLANAINRTITNINKTAAEQVTQNYNTTKKAVQKTLKHKRATKTNLVGTVTSKAPVIALAKFKVSPNRPVSYKSGRPSPKVYKAAVKKGAASKPLEGNPKAFVAIMKNGHKGVFERTGRFEGAKGSEKRTRIYNSKSHRCTKHNEIIKELFGPSIPHMIKNEKSMAYIQEEANSTLQKRIDAEINNILRKG